MIEVRGEEQLAKLARLLADMPKDMRRELSKEMAEATKPLKDAFRREAQTLPKRGGLADKVGRSRVSTRTTRRGVRVTVRNAYALAQIDKGSVRHPVFGNPEVWVTQPVTPGVWTKPTAEFGPEAKRRADAALERAANSLNGV